MAENVVSYSVDLALKSEVAQPEAVTVYLTEHENVVDSKNAKAIVKIKVPALGEEQVRFAF